MDTDLKIRKSPRLKSFDYASSRYYFITVCSDGRRRLFGSVIPTRENGEMLLNDTGALVQRHILRINDRYSHVRVDHYVIMPNHIHMILELQNNNEASLTQVIGLFKSGVSREVGYPVWQRSFHDHVIRNESDYINIWTYIDNNPAQWAMDKYYC